jgi:hypothetical protein
LIIKNKTGQNQPFSQSTKIHIEGPGLGRKNAKYLILNQTSKHLRIEHKGKVVAVFSKKSFNSIKNHCQTHPANGYLAGRNLNPITFLLNLALVLKKQF